MKVLRIVGLVLVASHLEAAQLVAKRGGGGEYAPVNEAKGGTVKYNSTGFGAEGRRQDAYKTMFKHCGGPYKVLREDTRREGSSAIVTGPAVNVITQDWTYFDFECQPNAAPKH